MAIPTPTQTRTVDPYASYNSNVVNGLTKMISNGLDCVVASNPINVTRASATTLTVSAGYCIKDDVLIEISPIVIDMTDSDSYASISGGFWNEDGYYFVVLEYVYTKSKPAPVATIKLIQPDQWVSVYSATSHLLLKVVEVSSNNIDDVWNHNPSDDSYRVIFSNTLPNNNAKPTADYQIQPDDRWVWAEASDTMTLPFADGETLHTITKEDTGVGVTIEPISGDTIEGNVQIVLNNQYDSVTLKGGPSNTWYEV